MRHITTDHMKGFTDELQKEASLPQLIRVGKSLRGMASKHLGTRTGQLAAGGGVGAVGGAAAGDGGDGRLANALKGAALGAGIVGGGVLATKGGRAAVGGGLKRFGQRQRYALTGKGVDTVEQAKKIKLLRKEPNPEHFQSLRGKFKGKAYEKALRMHKAEEEAFKKGYHSVPGVLHALTSGSAKDLVRSGWQRGGVPTKLFAGLGAYETGRGLIEKPTEGGPGRMQKALRGAGSALGWMVAPATLASGPLLGYLGERAGGAVGKAGDVGVAAARRRFGGKVTPYQRYGGYQGGGYQWR